VTKALGFISHSDVGRHDNGWNHPEPVGRLRAITLPDNGRDLAGACGVEVIAALDSVKAAVHHAAGILPPDGVVMFSPAAPTPPAAGNWRLRSDAFRTAVATLPS
jgi:hypothetical protein